MSEPNHAIEQQLFTLLRRANPIHVSTSRGDYELERSSYGILCLLDDEGPLRLGQIAATFNLDPSTITRQVQAVERLGLGARTPDPQDRRASLLDLTDAGREAVRTTRAHRRRMLDLLLEDWTEEERTQFLHALTRFNATVARWMEQGGPDAAPEQDPSQTERST